MAASIGGLPNPSHVDGKTTASHAAYASARAWRRRDVAGARVRSSTQAVDRVSGRSPPPRDPEASRSPPTASASRSAAGTSLRAIAHRVQKQSLAVGDVERGACPVSIAERRVDVERVGDVRGLDAQRSRSWRGEPVDDDVAPRRIVGRQLGDRLRSEVAATADRGGGGSQAAPAAPPRRPATRRGSSGS